MSEQNLSFDIPVITPLTSKAPDGKRLMTPEEMINDNKPKVSYLRVKFHTEEGAKLFKEILEKNGVEINLLKFCDDDD